MKRRVHLPQPWNTATSFKIPFILYITLPPNSCLYWLPETVIKKIKQEYCNTTLGWHKDSRSMVRYRLYLLFPNCYSLALFINWNGVWSALCDLPLWCWVGVNLVSSLYLLTQTTLLIYKKMHDPAVRSKGIITSLKFGPLGVFEIISFNLVRACY